MTIADILNVLEIATRSVIQEKDYILVARCQQVNVPRAAHYLMCSDDAVDRLRDEAGHLLVARAADRDDWIGATVLEIAAGDKLDWTLKEWRALLHDLHRTPGKLADWLDLNT